MILSDVIKLLASTDIQCFVRKEGGRYFVKSHEGKNLSRGYTSRGDAEKRLRQIEYFKHLKGSKLEDEHHLADEETMNKIRKDHPDWSEKRIAHEMSRAEDGKGPYRKLRKSAGPTEGT